MERLSVHQTAPSIRAVEVTAHGSRGATGPSEEGGRGAPSVAVIVVTWNRGAVASQCVAGLAAQTYQRGRMDVVVIDNASSDGTLDLLVERWRPETIVDNATDRAHEPNFQPRPVQGERGNAAGFRSLTVVRNTHNHGGCGGFNTGLAYVDRVLSRAAVGAARGGGAVESSGVDFVWLVDDDAELPPEALVNLTNAAGTDPRIGLIGSRTVDVSDKRTTIETTIYLNRDYGSMCDEPPVGHPQYESHRRWVKQVGGVRGGHRYTGLRDVDVVSACSLLARWSGVQKVGFWDWRYFIYCDDADWCLRFGKAGYRVVLCLDAVVYHTPWNMKLTPARIYYAQRNMVWTIQKILPPGQLRQATRRWMRSILKDSLRAATHRRLFHAEIIRRTADDIVAQRTGKTAGEGPAFMPIIEALRLAGCLRREARVAVLCALGNRADASVIWAEQIRHTVQEAVNAGVAPEEPRWTLVVRNDVADAAKISPGTPGTIVYGGHLASRVKKQVPILRLAPDAVVVFDQTNDFPAVRGRWNIHVESRDLSRAQMERDGPGARLRFLGRWIPTALRALWYGAAVRPYVSPTRYG